MDNQSLWKIIDAYFEGNPQALVAHHLDSYNDFFGNKIFQLFKDKNPVQMLSKYDETLKDYKYQCLMYFGGKDGKRVYYGKPTIHDAENPHYMFPNEARLRNMTYSMSIHYDIELEFVYILADGEMPKNVSEDMLNEMISEQLGGNKYGPLEFDDDYAGGEDYAEYDGNANFKSVNGGDTQPSLDAAAEGGAEPKRRRGQKEKNPIKLTTAVAALLRETNEKSVVSHKKQVYSTVIEKVLLGRFPIMVQSQFCILHGLPRELKYNMGECVSDVGGYFIIDGKEKTVIMQEKFGDNMLYIEKGGEAAEYAFSASIRSVSENISKPVRTLKVGLMAPSKKYEYGNIVVNIPNVREPVPLFIVFRALGIISDKEIIEYCLLDREKYEMLEDAFIPSVYDAGSIMTQQSAVLYIAHLTKYHTVSYAMKILNDFFLPHIGENNYVEKALYLGNIVFQLLCVAAGLDAPTDRDNYKYKRVEVVGSLIYELFLEYYTIQQKYIHLEFEKLLYKNQDMYEENLHKLIFDNYREIFKTRIVDDGFRRAFKGNWGAQSHTKRVGVVQDLNRLSFNSAISHLRKTNLPLDSSVKLVGPRVLHNSHWGFIDPIDTPDGGNIGLHKTLSIMTTISRGASREPLLLWLREHIGMKQLEECPPLLLSTLTKVMVNGLWAGAIDDPINSVNKMKLFRRNGLLPVHTSISFDIKKNTVFIYTDAGRLCRPIFYKDEETGGKMSYSVSKQFVKDIKDGGLVWDELVSGFNKKSAAANYHYSVPVIYDLHQLYDGVESETNPAKMKRFIDEKAVIDYIDPCESEQALIALNAGEWEKDALKRDKYTHMEIHESLIFGVMCNMIIFPEHNPPTRNSFSCGQSKQAVSMYHTNHQVRMDKTAVVLNSGQVPLVKSRYMEYVNHESNPYGENAIVAIMCYTGYNVEDAVLINEAAIQRGLFRTTYYTTYEAHEETTKKGNATSDKHFANVETLPNVFGLKSGYDYSQLDAFGLIKENTPVNDKTILIGLTSNSAIDPNARVDMSVKPKKGQLGMVDKAFITEGEEGERIAKIRVRDIRIPSIGDKMASRSGQKGTVGMIVRECDMPFTSYGVRPDIIINPHAIPTRMTIGQLVECIIGKACAQIGAFSDCTAFNNKGSKAGVFGELLPKVGFHSSGNEILYNGMTGEQIESEIFIGPTYYMRLKHMVKDKINYRATGPRAALTRQPVGGRANDGGLRIGEMERDVLVSHGITDFCAESMMERGDKYYMAVCNNTGMMAIYNETKNVFMSPMADGPLVFNETADGKDLVLNNVSRFGRSFSIVCVPYSFKLLLQELQAMNIHLRIITDKNINQIESMSYSDNIQKLTYGAIQSPQELGNQIRKILAEKNTAPQKTPTDELLQTHIDPRISEIRTLSKIDASPDYPPSSPEDERDNSIPDYPVASPAYVPPEPRSPDYPPPSNASFISPPSAETQTQNTSPGIMDTIANAFASPFAASPSPEMEGGGEPANYVLGEDVCYVKSPTFGLPPHHPWKVIKVGNRFYTIETELGENGVRDSIQVVEPFEIYRRSPVQDDGYNHYPLMMAEHGVPNGAYPPQYLDPYDHQPKINISPVIKIVNGPDNSTTNGEAAGETSTQTIANDQVGVVSTGQNNKPVVPSKINHTPSNTATATEPKSSSSGEKSFLGGMIDFGKSLLIKKVG